MELALLFELGFAEKVREGIVQIDQGFLGSALADLIHIREFGGFQGVQFFMKLLCIGHGQASSTSLLLARQPPVKSFSRTARVFLAGRDLRVIQIKLRLVASNNRTHSPASSAFIACSTHCLIFSAR